MEAFYLKRAITQVSHMCRTQLDDQLCLQHQPSLVLGHRPSLASHKPLARNHRDDLVPGKSKRSHADLIP